MNKSNKVIISTLKQLLLSNLDKKTKAGQEKYLKYVVKTYGIRAPHFKKLFSSFYTEHIKPLDTTQQIQLGFEMFDSEYHEEKNAGISVLVKNLKHLNDSHVPHLATVIDKHVYDWFLFIQCIDHFKGRHVMV